MATIDTLASLNSVTQGNLLVLIVEDLTPGTQYKIWKRSSDDLREEEVLCAFTEEMVLPYNRAGDDSSYWGSAFTADANGRIIDFFSNLVADASMNEHGGLTIHNRDDPDGPLGESAKTSDPCREPPADRRLDGETGFLFSTTAGFTPLDPWYVTVDNLVATPGVGEVNLSWDTGSKLDAGRGSIEYTVLRRNAAGDPGPSDILVDGLTSTTYTDTTPANGVTYKYRIHARLAWDGFDPWTADGYLPYADFPSYGLDMSNIETVTLGDVADFTVSLNVRIPLRAPS